MHVEWLPGGRFEEGNSIPDPLFEELDATPGDEQLQRLCDPMIRGFIFNFIRECGGLEYINIGRISESLSKSGHWCGARRGVYLAELQPRGATLPLVRFIRFRSGGFASGWMKASLCWSDPGKRGIHRLCARSPVGRGAARDECARRNQSATNAGALCGWEWGRYGG